MSSQLSSESVRGRKNVINNKNQLKVGQVFYLADDVAASANSQLRVLKSAQLVKCVYAVNESGGNLTPGHAIAWKSNKHQLQVGGQAGDGALVDGVIDPEIPGTLAVGDTFAVLIGGPCEVIVSAAITEEYIVGAGSGKVKEAAATVNLRSGRTLDDGSGLADNGTMRVFLECER
jgi:hypothetical protein